MNIGLLSELYFLFESERMPPSMLFDLYDNEPLENPHWDLLYAQSWDRLSFFDVRMNWNAFCYFNDASLTYFIPFIIKCAIIDPRSVDLLQSYYLLGSLLCGSADTEVHNSIIKDRFACKHWALILKVISQKSYLSFCEDFNCIEELDKSILFLNTLLINSSSGH